jgi:hypothetical protein
LFTDVTESKVRLHEYVARENVSVRQHAKKTAYATIDGGRFRARRRRGIRENPRPCTSNHPVSNRHARIPFGVIGPPANLAEDVYLNSPDVSGQEEADQLFEVRETYGCHGDQNFRLETMPVKDVQSAYRLCEISFTPEVVVPCL